MTDSITWTSREWLAVVAAIPGVIGPKGPTPAQLDAAQRAALPPDRWRPRTSMYGRLNRARNMGQLNAALLRSAQAAGETADRLRKMQAALEDVTKQIAELRARNPLLRCTFEPVNAGGARAVLPTENEGERTTTVTRLNRVDVVGLIGHQITRVQDSLHPDTRRVVRFVHTTDVHYLKVCASRAVLVTGFINHAVIDAYDAVDARYFYVPKPTAARIVPLVEQLAHEEDSAPLVSAKRPRQADAA